LSAKHGHLAHHFDSLEQQHEASTLGMWLFLATELLFFGALFTAYIVYRTSYPEAFAEASSRLDVWLGAVNTAVLLGSSLTMALAVHAAQVGRRRMLVLCLALTVVLGSAFLGIKASEYLHDYEQELIPGLAFQETGWSSPGQVPWIKLFFVLYFVMTGIHALHMIIGIGLLLVFIYLAWRNTFAPEYYTPVEMMGLYWHFVDIVWIFLFPLLYLIGTR
jgi:cytochrome c oxidase subunit 3